MPAFFAHSRGSVVRLAGPKRQHPFRVVMAEMDVGAENVQTRAIVTQVSAVENGNYQISHSFGDAICAYTFGDRVGELRIGGVAFLVDCNGQPTGIKQLYDNYNKYRIANSSEILGISIGEVNYRGHLVGMTCDVADAEGLLGQWMMQYRTVPGVY